MLAQTSRDAKLDPKAKLRGAKTDARAEPVFGICGYRAVIARAFY